MRVLGIDPGLSTTGFGVVEQAAGRLRFVGAGVVRTSAAEPPEMRLVRLRAALLDVIEGAAPDVVAVERVFFNANVRTAMSVGQASGIALEAAGASHLPVSDYTPTEVKQAVVGVGNASKQQVQSMVVALLGLEAPPRPADAADACALAICHLNRSRFVHAVEAAR